MEDSLPAALDGAGRRTAGAAAIEAALLLGGFAVAPEAAPPAALAGVRGAIAAIRPAAQQGYDPAEIINRMVAAGKAGMPDFWRSHYVATGRRLLSELCGAGEGVPDVSALPPRRFTVEIRRRFDLTGAGSRARLRLPLALAGAALEALTIEPLLPDGSVQHRALPGRLEVVVADPHGEIAIGARLSFTARAGVPRGPDPAAGDPRWLAPHEGPIKLTARVRALAARLAAEEAPAEAVQAFYDHLLGGFTCGVIPYDRLGRAAATDWVLATGWYDCRLGAALLVALARARGIPARLVGGYLLWRVPTEHYWAEVHLPGQGWTPYDLLGWDLSAGGADAGWRCVLAGAVEYRMRTQLLPDIFTGAAGGPTAPAWHRLVRATADGTETRFVSVADGRLLYAEEVRIIA